MMANMAASLILHKKIATTTAKAKALRVYVEPLITKSKTDSTHSRRVVFSYLQDKEAVSELFREVSPKIMERQGGYTRILKTGSRPGDNADMCIIELVDFNENMLKAKDTAEKSTRRRRRSTRKKPGAQDAEATAAEAFETAEKAETTQTVETAPDAKEGETIAEAAPEAEVKPKAKKPKKEVSEPEADAAPEDKKEE